jgi:hypothetical protein
MGEFIYDWKKAVISLVIFLIGTFFIVSINASNFNAYSINWTGIYLFLTPVLSFVCFFPLLITRIRN